MPWDYSQRVSASRRSICRHSGRLFAIFTARVSPEPSSWNWGQDLENSGAGLERILEHLNTALEESPAPEFEWNRLTEVLGLELLSQLLGISATSVRRYKTAARSTPDDVADRLHFLSLIVGDLSGAYNEIGVRQWFARKRAQLGGRAPSEFLKGCWKPGQPGPRQVQDLARALIASPAT